MTGDLLKELTTAISIQMSCIDKTYINGFAGTGKARKREMSAAHSIAGRIVERAFLPYSFNRGDVPASKAELHMAIFTVLFDIDDDEARRWSDRTEWDVARHEAARGIAKALLRDFTVEKREIVSSAASGPHGTSNVRYSGEE